MTRSVAVAQRNLKLLEAMVLVLLERKLATNTAVMPTKELAEVIRVRQLYAKEAGGPADASQVRVRAWLYPALFDTVVIEGSSLIHLRDFPRRQ